MSRNNRREGAGIWIGCITAVVIVITAAWISGFDFAAPTGKKLRILSDAFLAAGAVTAGIWILSRVASAGFFDLFSYSFRELGNRLNPARREEKPERFYEYKTRIAGKRKKGGYSMLLVGIGCIALSILFLILFYRTNA